MESSVADCVYSAELVGRCTVMENGVCKVCLAPLAEMIETDQLTCIDSRANCKSAHYCPGRGR